MTQMTALRAYRRGGPEVLVVEAAPIPVPATGEVLVAVHAAAITFDELTWKDVDAGRRQPDTYHSVARDLRSGRRNRL